MFSRGPGTLSIDRRAFHAPIRADVVRRFNQLRPPSTPPSSGDAADADTKKQRTGPRLLLLKGGDVLPVYDTDGEILLRQEAYFHYLFGVEEEGFLGALDLDSGATALFSPRLPASYAVWFGRLEPPSHYRNLYAVDECMYKDELQAWLCQKAPSELHVLAGKNTDSGFDAAQLSPPDAEELAKGAGEGCALVRGGAAFDALVEARVHKTQGEVEVIAYANDAASRAHVALMRECAKRAAKANGANGEEEVMREFQLEALFQYETYSLAGCRFQGYTPIVAAGENAAVLHYGEKTPRGGDPSEGGFG
jgi:Xaa-Pro dipeptidase